MVTREQVMNKIFAIIGTPGHRKQVVDRALDIFAAVASHEPIPALCKSLPVVPNREPGKWEKITNDRNDREQAGTSSGSDTSNTSNTQNPRPKPDDKKEKTAMEPITKAQIERADRELDRLSKAKEPRLWGMNQRGLYDPINNGPRTAATPQPAPQPAAAPTPNPAQALRSSRLDTSKLSGRQLAAVKAGLPVDFPNLNSLNFDQMKAAAHQLNVTTARESAAKQGIHYGPQGETYHRK